MINIYDESVKNMMNMLNEIMNMTNIMRTLNIDFNKGFVEKLSCSPVQN